MKRLAWIIIFALVPSFALADSSICYDVSGAGTTGANGHYVYSGYDQNGEGVYDNGSFQLIHNSYHELTAIGAPASGYYYNSNGPSAGTFEDIDTVNGLGTAPAPTVVGNFSCSGGGGGGTTTPTTTPATTRNEQLLMYGIGLFFLSYIGWCYMFGPVKIKQRE